jgi:hypothetical protein
MQNMQEQWQLPEGRQPLGTDLCLKLHPLLKRKANYEGYWAGSGKLIAI